MPYLCMLAISIVFGFVRKRMTKETVGLQKYQPMQILSPFYRVKLSDGTGFTIA